MAPVDTDSARPFDHRFIDDEAIAERYVTGRLPDDLVARFEEHYLDCPECVARVEDAERLQRGLARVGAEEVARAAVARGFFDALLRSRALRLGVVGLVSALVVVPTLWQQMRIDGLVAERDAALERAGAPHVGGTVFELAPLRGAPGGDAGTAGTEPATVLGLPFESTAPLVFALEVPSVPDVTGYRVDLHDEAGAVVWKSSVGPLDARGRLVLSLPADQMPTGNVELRAVAVPAVPGHGERTVARFPLAVLRSS